MKYPKELLCDNCYTITVHLEKLDAIKNGNLVCSECSKENSIEQNFFRYKLVRERDSLTKFSKDAGFITWEEGKYKELNRELDSIEVGTSCILSPFNMFYTWQTTTIDKIIEHSKDFVKFKTANSSYTLYDLN